jgi:hypothetical protein
MQKHLYELLWQVETDTLSFIYRELKGFGSDVEARKYGKTRELNLNDGASIQDKAQDGYYFKYHSASRIEEIDGCKVTLA